MQLIVNANPRAIADMVIVYGAVANQQREAGSTPKRSKLDVWTYSPHATETARLQPARNRAGLRTVRVDPTMDR